MVSASNDYPQTMLSLRSKKKCQCLGKKILVGQVDFDHSLVCGQVIKFDISTTLYKVVWIFTACIITILTINIRTS